MRQPSEQSAFVSQAEFARIKDVSRKTVTGWKIKGLLVLTADGLVDVSASLKRLDERPATYRGGVTTPGEDVTSPGNEVTGNSAGEGNDAGGGNTPADDSGVATPLLDGDPEEIAAAAKWSLADAQRIKENYLALLRKQEFEVSSGKLVDIDEVGRQVESEYALVRERLLAIPGKLAAQLVDLTRAEIEVALQAEVSEALRELHTR